MDEHRTSSQPGLKQVRRILALTLLSGVMNAWGQSETVAQRDEAAATPTGFVYHADYLKHNAGRNHPESPLRVQAIADSLQNSPLWTFLVQIEPRVAEEIWVSKVHGLSYLRRLEQAAAKAPTALDPDTTVSSDSYRVALLAAGGALAAVDAIMGGRIRNAFVASRPPGHHAFPDRASGFCLINHVAVATRYVQDKYGLKRVLIIDWDVHHGNATQAFFYQDPSVLYFSTHQHPHYPGTGRSDEKGSGPGLATTINVPLPAGSGDAEIIGAFETQLVPAATAFEPAFVFVSAGFDSHAGDPLAHFEITTEGFAELTKIVRGIADRFANGRLVSVLEGGYNLANLASAARAHVSVLADPRPVD